MSTAIRGRHRAARRPITPLTTMSRAAAQGLGTAGRRTAVVAVSSGLAASLVGGAPALAADVVSSGTDVQTLAGVALESLETAPTVVVAEDAIWTDDDAALKVKAAPEKEEEPAVAASTLRTTVTASRSSERAPITDSSTSTRSSTRSASTSTSIGGLDDGTDTDAGIGAQVAEIAKRYIGVPYVYGGSTPSGFDCSGFTSYVYAKVGISLPHSSTAQRSAGRVVSAADARPGDIIWSPGHVAIYLGNGKQIDAPRPGHTIQIRSIWQSNPVFIRVG